jgi:hypothetical protein
MQSFVLLPERDETARLLGKGRASVVIPDGPFK